MLVQTERKISDIKSNGRWKKKEINEHDVYKEVKFIYWRLMRKKNLFLLDFNEFWTVNIVSCPTQWKMFVKKTGRLPLSMKKMFYSLTIAFVSNKKPFFRWIETFCKPLFFGTIRKEIMKSICHSSNYWMLSHEFKNHSCRKTEYVLVRSMN